MYLLCTFPTTDSKNFSTKSSTTPLQCSIKVGIEYVLPTIWWTVVLAWSSRYCVVFGEYNPVWQIKDRSSQQLHRRLIFSMTVSNSVHGTGSLIVFYSIFASKALQCISNPRLHLFRCSWFRRVFVASRNINELDPGQSEICRSFCDEKWKYYQVSSFPFPHGQWVVLKLITTSFYGRQTWASNGMSTIMISTVDELEQSWHIVLMKWSKTTFIDDWSVNTFETLVRLSCLYYVSSSES